MKREYVDFISVPVQQLEIHARLENWGRWCHGSGHAQMSPMFRMYRSSQVYTGYQDTHVPVDASDAAKVAKGVVGLPESHRHAMSWYYVNKGSPRRACQTIGCGMDALNQYVLDARTMLINRGM